MRVQLFATCVGDLVFPEAVEDAEALLRAAGHEVEFPAGQVCCGQPAFNAGHRAAARRVARGFARAFSRDTTVVVPSGSCATMLSHYLPDPRRFLAATASRSALAVGRSTNCASSPPSSKRWISGMSADSVFLVSVTLIAPSCSLLNLFSRTTFSSTFDCAPLCRDPTRGFRNEVRMYLSRS
jgi:Cysteine-rich domain